MGEEAHNLGEEGLHMNGFDDSVPISISESKTSLTINDKIYVITESDKGVDSSINVLIYFKSTGKWVTPTVLGTKPGLFKGHSAALLNTDRILIIKRGSEVNDCAWFLEVDTPFVREQMKTLGTEVVAWSKGVRGDGLVPVVISGPSGVGKGTLISKLMEEFPSTFGFSVSHTTRLPRQKEVDGVHYHFSERSKMEKDILSGKFLETASVHGNLYGTSIEAVETVTDSGQRCILDIDVQGARSVKNSSLEAIFVFVAPPSFDELEKRLRSRGTETEEQVEKRLRNAMIELKEGKSSGLFDYILINDNLQTCYESIKKILGLDGAINGSCQPCTKTEASVCDGTDQKFVIQCQCKSNEIGNGSKDMERFVLDVSSLKGGAPGRTRGLKIEVYNQFVDVPTKVL